MPRTKARLTDMPLEKRIALQGSIKVKMPNGVIVDARVTSPQERFAQVVTYWHGALITIGEYSWHTIERCRQDHSPLQG